MPDESKPSNLPAQPAKPLSPKPATETAIPLEPVNSGAAPASQSQTGTQIPAQVRSPSPQPAAQNVAIPKAVPPQPRVHVASAKPAQPSAPIQPRTQPAQNGNSTAKTSMADFGTLPGARADLIYGDTNTTKTTQLGIVADWLRAKYGKTSRLISADPGGWESIQAVVDDGTISAFPLIQQRTNFYETLEKLCLGWWPKDVNDPQSQLIPPSQNGLRDIGGVFFESLTTMCDIMMRTNTTDMENINVPRSAAEKENIIKQGEFVHRFSSQTDYGSIQDIIGERVRDSGMLPVRKVIWTAVETKGEDEQKRAVYGPDLIGKKATGKCGPWFGNLIHLDFINTTQEVQHPLNSALKMTVVKPVPFLFTRSHIDPADPTKMQWPAKTRAPRTMWNKIPDFMPPDMSKLYELLDSLLEQDKAARKAAREAVIK